jgi:hypothetical protein
MRKDINLLIFWIFVVVKAGAVGHIRVSEVKLDFIILTHFKIVHGEINSVLLKFNLA